MELKFFNGTSRNELYPFLQLSFSDLSSEQYQKVNNGHRFVEWIWAENKENELVACAAIFKKRVTHNTGYKMGLFCTHPQFRRRGIGKKFYQYISSKYKPLEWGAITPESINFYTSVGAINHGKVSYGEGKNYVIFTNV